MAMISVNMAVHNTERYVAEAVNSILSQSCADFEFIIIDDGSTDGSRRILQDFAQRDTRIRLVCHEKQGLNLVRNEALRLSTGEFVAVIDSDDIALPQRLEKQIAYMQAHPECVAVGTGVLLIDADGDPIKELSLKADHEDIDAVHLEGCCGAMSHTSTIFRRNAILAAGGYAEDLPAAHDYDLYLRLAEIGRLYNLPDVLMKYRHHLSSVGYATRVQQLTCAGLAFSRACQRRGLTNPDVVPGFTRWIRNPLRPAIEFRTWGWWALSGGNVSTARKYAWKTLLRQPHRFESWRLGYCALRGH